MAAPASTVIVGRALVGSLGLDAVTACAAARAGIVRASPAEQFLAADDENAAGSPIAVHCVAGLTKGFEGSVRLARLLAAGLQDLRTQLPDAPWRGATTGLFLAMPSPRREIEGAALLPTPEGRARFEQENARAPVVDPEERAAKVLAQAMEFAEFEDPLQLQFVDTSGTTAVSAAVSAARDALQRGLVELAIVAGVDSLVEAKTLHWLDRTARLRTPVRPAGVHPGEACALLVLEEGAHARKRRATPLATIEACVSKVEPAPILSGGVANGAALAAAIDALRPQAGWDQHAPSITLDLNGENARASEWGNALTHLITRSPMYHHIAVEVPALSFGDTGAASGAVAACMALHAFARGYAAFETVAVINASDGGQRTALLLRAPS